MYPELKDVTEEFMDQYHPKLGNENDVQPNKATSSSSDTQNIGKITAAQTEGSTSIDTIAGTGTQPEKSTSSDNDTSTAPHPEKSTSSDNDTTTQIGRSVSPKIDIPVLSPSHLASLEARKLDELKAKREIDDILNEYPESPHEPDDHTLSSLLHECFRNYSISRDDGLLAAVTVVCGSHSCDYTSKQKERILRSFLWQEGNFLFTRGRDVRSRSPRRPKSSSTVARRGRS